MRRGPDRQDRDSRREAIATFGRVALPSALGWAAAVALAATRSAAAPALIAAVGLATIAATEVARRRQERRRWIRPVRSLARNVAAFNDHPDEVWDLPATADLADLIEPVRVLQGRYMALRDRVARRLDEPPIGAYDTGEFATSRPAPGVMTRSGSYEPPETIAFEMMATGEFSSLDMINRLEPRTWRWLDSSATEQEFLGWDLARLREKSFLDVVHEDDRELARQQLRSVLARGEGHGLIYKIVTARGAVKSVELNIGARYGVDRKITHLRCHLADVTAKLRDEDELRRRTQELVQANDGLRRANRELQALKSELQQGVERLASANAELSRKNQELDEFTRVVSHDLQEPVRTLIGFSDFLLSDHGHQLDESGRELVHHLIDASRRLRTLIRDLLDLSRAGKVTDDFEAVDLGEVVETVRADLAGLIRDRGASVRVESPLPSIWGDRTRIGQLMANLIGNGLKYNANPSPRVEVSARPGDDGRTVVVAVRDDGIGIDPRYHAKIFQLFRRLHTREEYEGTGAGLAICQKIAQAHGGRIRVESEGAGKGSTFLVTLPAPPGR
ncbi:sensor histidine kinase [Tundrisphaera sp. TA3]|uniref:sensor histidine kinase n=1 Tax=Tundrisphaera sp. TA3 TaxID=3435775 RepID=UPI003EBE05CE